MFVKQTVFQIRQTACIMIIIDKNLPVVVKRAVDDTWQQIQRLAQRWSVRLAFLALVALLLSQKKFSVHFTIGNVEEQTASLVEALPPKAIPAVQVTSKAGLVASDDKWWDKVRAEQKDIRQQLNLANAATAVGEALTAEQQQQAARYSNLGFVLNPALAQKLGVDPVVVAAKNKLCYDYIARFSKTAKEEAELFRIPAAITLAQGLLESNVGKSSLAVKENNHFGIKCRKKCIGCRCANYTDDSRYDMFRIFESPWESFREHSKLLQSKRYKHLTNLPLTD